MYRSTKTIAAYVPSGADSVKYTSAEDFATYFTEKVDTIQAATASASPPTIRPRSVLQLGRFDGVTLADLTNAVQKAPCKQCDLDPVLTWLVKKFGNLLCPVITEMIRSFSRLT